MEELTSIEYLYTSWDLGVLVLNDVIHIEVMANLSAKDLI